MKKIVIVLLAGVVFFIFNAGVASAGTGIKTQEQLDDRAAIVKISKEITKLFKENKLGRDSVIQLLLNDGVEEKSIALAIAGFLREIQQFSTREEVEIPKIKLQREDFEAYDTILRNLLLIESCRGGELRYVRKTYLEQNFPIDYMSVLILNTHVRKLPKIVF